MKEVEGDLIQYAIDGEFDIIVHGCNCFCEMGAGIAKEIKTIFPLAYEADLKTPEGDMDKLGTYSYARVCVSGREFYVINAYTQYDWRGKGNKVSYEAIEKVFKLIKRNFSGKRVGYPLIGAGLGGGDWKVISKIIDTALQGENHTLVKYKNSKILNSGR